jgi:hypothetical protein
MLKKPVPRPGYSATKPCLAAFQTLFHDLGEQDACIQLQEISQRFLEATAEGMGSKVENFLQILYQAHEVPHGTYDFMKMRNVSHKSYLVLTYASFEGALNEAIDEFKARTGATWSKKDAHEKALPPLAQVAFNLPSNAKTLQTAPEYRLIEYYRFVRIAESHRTPVTSAAAVAAFGQLTATDHQHFAKYAYINGAPNHPDSISFEDFKLFTRALKYFSNLLNDILA